MQKLKKEKEKRLTSIVACAIELKKIWEYEKSKEMLEYYHQQRIITKADTINNYI